MDKNVKKLVYGYEKFTGVDLNIHKTPSAPVTTLSKSELKEPKYIDTYRSFVYQIMWYTNKVEPDFDNAASEVVVHMIHLWP